MATKLVHTMAKTHRLLSILAFKMVEKASLRVHSTSDSQVCISRVNLSNTVEPLEGQIQNVQKQYIRVVNIGVSVFTKSQKAR